MFSAFRASKEQGGTGGGGSMISKSENTERRGAGIGALAVALALLAAGAASADARTDYLLEMLKNGGSYRVRVQAATTLGKIRCEEAVPALVSALEDDHELVVISAATSLGQIGDTSVIDEMEKAAASAPSKAARSQIEASLRILRALTPEGDVERVRSAEPQLLIRVDAMGNSSSEQREDICELMRRIVIGKLKREPGVVLQEEGLGNRQVKKKLAREKLDGFILSGSIIRMEKVASQMVVKISLNVFSNPDYNLVMMPSAEGAVQVHAGTVSRRSERDAQEKALERVAEALVHSVVEKLRDADGS